MMNKKRLLSVAAAVAISSSMVSAAYLPLTSTGVEDKWVMFGVTGFHANGAVTGSEAGGAVDAGTFSISDDAANVATDTGGDELYGEEGTLPLTVANAITDGTDVLGSVKRIDDVASSVEVRVDVSSISYYESDPVRTIYVKQNADDDKILFAFSYKSALEGEKLEFSTTTSGATDDAYRITINSENTYNNPAIAEYIPAIEATGGEDGDAGNYLTSIEDAVDYDFTDGPEAPNPIKSADYLKVDHQDTVGSGESLRLYSYDSSGIWNLYDSRNTFQDFTELEKGKGYWGKMDLSAARAAGFVLGSPSISTQDYLDAGIAEGWNLLAFNADNADLRAATTGLIVTVGAAGTITLTDVSGNHTTVAIAVNPTSATTLTASARLINQTLKAAKINGTIPDTMNIVAIPVSATQIALLSDEKFILKEDADATLTVVTTLAGKVAYDAVTLTTDASNTQDITDGLMSVYGEYALVVKPENELYAEFDIRCESLATQLVLPTVAGITAATCIDNATFIDANYDETVDDLILMAADEPFEIRDHTFTRVFDYKVSLEAGEITALNAATTFPALANTATFTSAVAEVQTLTITADDTHDGDETMTVTYGTNASGGTASVGPITLSDSDDADVVATEVAAALNLDATFSALATATVATNVVTITYDSDTTVGLNITTPVSATVAGTTATLAGAGLETTAGSQQTATQVAATIAGAAHGNFVLVATPADENIIADGTQILFRTKDANENEFRIVETGDGDNLTPSTTTNAWAQGAISDVFSPNALVKAALTNEIVDTIADGAAGVAETVTHYNLTVATPLGSIVLDPYVVEAADLSDSDAVYDKLETHINDQLEAKALDSTVAITGVNGSTDFDAIMTITGSDLISATLTFTGATSLGTTSVATLGTPSIGNGDITEDLKFNFVLSPNYVLDGPLYEMKAAGFSALAMVTGTMDNAGTSMGWDGIDLTRRPSEWLDSQDYNLFTVDNAAGYWTFLEAAEANPLTFETTPFVGEYTQHFNQDGKTYNQVAGQLGISVYGISEYDERESARVVAVVGGSQVELSRDGLSDVYSGQVSSYELKEMAAGKEYDIQVIVADGLGYRIPATSTGTVVDFKAPAAPALVFNAGTVAITNDAADGVTQYYLYNGEIPATGTESAKLMAISVEDAAAFNLCGSSTAFNRTGSYDLKFVALDGDDLRSSNVSDAFQIDAYAPLFKNSAIATNTRDGDPTSSLADIYYDSSCEVSEVAYDQSIQASSRSNLQTVKVAYEPKAVGTGAPLTVFVDGGSQTSTTASITYNEDYVGETVFVQLSGRVYSYELPNAATAVATTEEAPADLSTLGTYLSGQSLGN